MNKPFKIDGKTVDDSVLYYWSLQAISRALRFYAEATRQLEKGRSPGYVLAAVGGYYSLFHLGIFLACSAPQLLRPGLRKKLVDWFDHGKDPSRAPKHTEVEDFLRDCQAHQLKKSVLELFEKAQELRNFVNYGPDLKYTPQREFRVFNREHHPDECRTVVESLPEAFVDAVEWACHKGISDGALVPPALKDAAAYFTENKDGPPYYSEWSSAKVLARAEKFRAELQKKAEALKYPEKEAAK